MGFIIDVFFEMLAMLLGLLGMVVSAAGVLITIVGILLALPQVTDFLLSTFDFTPNLPTWFGWILGVMVLAIGVLMMALSSVMRKRIGRVKR
jgi:cell division protein FtsX